MQKENCIPADVDYLIGNHTDELTPWIPIIAARRKCNFFVLPCCPFNFHGKYVARRGDNGSQYDSFLRFVREVCVRLGFIVEEDRLSIPSTKRVRNCLNIPAETRLVLTKRFFDKILLNSDELKDGWRCGGAIELSELALMLTESEKQLMKQQCGGLQTFLRNQHQVFKTLKICQHSQQTNFRPSVHDAFLELTIL
ncbi:hypothetical protein NECAME_02561 [Necator americanus]|uniref:tRNA (uracil-O(2)-)-methyltransferase n=1 Tax=Necator americanus TaxID=51031 RepID=W2TD32_NECAM|nr:hypothetical protein NECAME_02561 [Necator americanus]ETN79738.1 hypothetical protein NECAME_02561 [Necator americanus]